jgi:hypothetical protein
VLGGQSLETSPPILALRERLSELGYVEGGNIAIEWRWAQGKDERYSDLAAELVKLKVDIIVAATTTGAQAAQRATTPGCASDVVAIPHEGRSRSLADYTRRRAFRFAVYCSVSGGIRWSAGSG